MTLWWEMEFNIKKKDNPNKDNYSKSDIDVAYEFSRKVIVEFKSFVKCIAIFGSAARKEEKPHDIDILIIVDDVTTVMTTELVDAYRVILEKIIRGTSQKLHVTTLKMTNFWDYIRRGDPIGLNILRDGVALYDTNLFEPLRILLKQGKMSPSEETVNLYNNKSLGSLRSSENHMLKAALDLYWAVIDSAHAVLMSFGHVPASPLHVADKMEGFLVKEHGLEKKYPVIMRKFYKLSKAIIHNQKEEVTGAEYESYKREADDFVKRMRKYLKE